MKLNENLYCNIIKFKWKLLNLSVFLSHNQPLGYNTVMSNLKNKVIKITNTELR